MPTAPLPPCRNPRCPRRAERNGWCLHCLPTTGDANGKGYGGARWRRFRAATIARFELRSCGDRPAGAPRTTDSLCQQQHVQIAGRVLDHIEPISGPEDSRFYDATNVQWLCDRCHNVKRSKESQRPSVLKPARHEEITWG